MFKKMLVLLIALFTMFSNISTVKGFSGSEAKNSNSVKSSLQSKSQQKSVFGGKDLSIGPKGNISSSINNAKEKSGTKTNTIVLRFKNINDVKKLGISEKIIGKLENTNTVILEIPVGADPTKIIAKYKKSSFIENAYVDIEVKKFFTVTDPYYSTYQWNLERIAMDSAWDITQGESSVLVAIIDSGFGPFSDVDGLVNGVDVSGSTILEDTYPGQYSYDGDLHGTAVTSLIASEINSTGIAGIAPNVKVMSVKVFANGAESTGSIQIAAGIRWAADHGADIINMSLGSNSSTPDERAAIEYALAKGVLIVAASGNDGYTDYISYPAAYPGVIAVGSTNNSNAVSLFSNEGPALGIVAPGENIYLANINVGNNSFAYISGTSFSSPTVAAVASLIKSEHPDFSSREIEQILFTGTDDIIVSGWDSSSGFGITNAKKALDVAAEPNLFDENNTVSGAVKLLANINVTGKNYPALDNDVYKFTLYQTSSIVIKVTPNGLQDLVIDLHDAAINQIIRIDNTQTGVEESSSLILSAGIYYINTYDFYGDAFKADSYQIRITTTDTDAPQILIKDGETILPNGSVSQNSLSVTVEDTSATTVTATKNSVSYAWPINGLFSESGAYVIHAVDASGNSSHANFIIQKSGGFIVTFNTQGGSLINPWLIPINETFASPDQPSKTGYSFSGWYTEAACINAWDFGVTTVTQDMTLFAKWVINQYTLSFDSQGGTAVSAKVVNYLSKVTAPLTPTKSGVTFAGWYKELTYKTLWNFSVDSVSDNTVIYAKWMSNPSVLLGAKAEAIGYDSVKLSWTQVAGVTYEIYRATASAGTYAKLGDVVAGTYTSTGLTTGRIYYFKVRPYKTEGAFKAYGSYSAVVSARPMPSTVKATVASASYTSIRTSWSAITGAHGYEVYRALSSTGTYYLIATTTANSYLNSYLTTNRAYYYKVRAYRTVGTTRYYGNFSTALMARPIPATPSFTSAVSLSSTSIKASWGSVAGATRYEVYRSTSLSGTYTLQITTSYLTYTKTALIKGTTYYYKVRAYRLVGTLKVYSGFSIIRKVVVGY